MSFLMLLMMGLLMALVGLLSVGDGMRRKLNSLDDLSLGHSAKKSTHYDPLCEFHDDF